MNVDHDTSDIQILNYGLLKVASWTSGSEAVMRYEA